MNMPPEAIAALAALGGTLAGGVVSYLTGRSLKNREWKLALLKDKLRDREKLYADFLVNAQRLLMKATESKVTKTAELDVMNNEFARIELVATEPVVKAARRICDDILVSHSQNSEKDERNYYDDKLAFIQAVRGEFSALERD